MRLKLIPPKDFQAKRINMCAKLNNNDGDNNKPIYKKDKSPNITAVASAARFDQRQIVITKDAKPHRKCVHDWNQAD